MNKKYKKYTGELKIRLLREHIMDKVSVSDICAREGIKPSVFYSWQKELFDRGSNIFDGSKKTLPLTSKYQKTIDKLEHKLQQKNEVLAELMQEHLSLKKEYGEI